MDEFQPLPQVTLFFPCEEAAVNMAPEHNDLQLGWWEIRKPLYHVEMPAGVKKGFGVRELFCYYQISGGRGDYQFIAECHQLDLGTPKKTTRLTWSDFFRWHFPDELAVVEDAVVLHDVFFPTPGMYLFTLKSKGQTLLGGESYLRVFEGANV